MSYNCCFCSRTFSKRSAYSQHVVICIKKVEFDEEESDSNDKTQDIDDISKSDDIFMNYVNDEV
jgi:hypothetical protein